jgi:CRISPR/Cas system CSM-associated protein Csm3 (group 7 of RAMP superfamily)
MPQGENAFNPYRWVPVSDGPVPRQKPAYRHRWEGLSGQLDCTLEALTPLLIGSSRGDGRFIRSGRTQRPFIPGTSLKGLIRALAELIGNAAIPFSNGHADDNHTLTQASQNRGKDWQLDIAARMFGYLNRGQVFAGLVRFSDGQLQGTAREIGPFKVVVGKPQPERHKPFYPVPAQRKLYHHRFGATDLTLAPANIPQTRTVYPLPPGVRFTFQVAFENLREEELALLLYCLVLEEEVTVTLSKEALGPDAHQPVTFSGPLRHKLGACKPQGGGSVKIGIDRMRLHDNMADRYRGQAAGQELEGEQLQTQLRQRTQAIMARTDETMRHLRAMLIYSANDPRKAVDYPDYTWFQQDKGTGTPLKPTL